jgi:lipopolysaccharide transport system ATP-binding protein
MTTPIIEVRNVGKRYRIGGQRDRYLSLREEIGKRFSAAARRESAHKREFWALRDVSFDVREGEAVGIVGRNGAGKSTFLKVLSRITPPTEGRIRSRGRVASLLEVGTGFHPELTGRENVFLNGAVLGMTRREIRAKFDEIVAFAEVEKFLDTPVKRYSSGMYVRLAFAVAAHLEPEILVVDEVLAVGDATFQKKCLGKMGDVTRSGRTVLFVSHNMAAVRDLCSRGVVLCDGRVRCVGPVEEAIADYLADARGGQAVVTFAKGAGSEGPVRFVRAGVDQNGQTLPGDIDVRQPFEVWCEVNASAEAKGVEISMQVFASAGHPVFLSSFTDRTGELLTLSRGTHRFTVSVPALFLSPGVYHVSLLAHRPNIAFLDRRDHCLAVTIEETGTPLRRFGLARFGDVIVDFPWRHTVLDGGTA